jgi:glycosyltransferase involved in cell wall biosynthesis
VKKFSIVTPCYNAERYIAETMRSVLNQRALHEQRIELEYIICDGQSNDKTVEIIQSVQQELDIFQTVKLISEPDSGMYDALSKGLKIASGDIIAYINAGDYYHPYAFDVVLEVFEAGLAQWLTGYSIFYNNKSQVVEAFLPFKYRQRFFNCGFYGGVLPVVQQESTFWSSELNHLIDWDAFISLKYAGDFYLWLHFSAVCDLKIVKSYLGGFRYHPGQLSSSDRYGAEIRSLTSPPKFGDRLLASMDRLLWTAPYRLKKQLNPSGIIHYDSESQCWRL